MELNLLAENILAFSVFKIDGQVNIAEITFEQVSLSILPDHKFDPYFDYSTHMLLKSIGSINLGQGSSMYHFMTDMDKLVAKEMLVETYSENTSDENKIFMETQIG